MMSTEREYRALVELRHAIQIAELAATLGFEAQDQMISMYPDHLGAVMADSILQAGVNYRSVVHPRVTSILEKYPDARELQGVQNVIASGILPHFLRWQHTEKIGRFTRLANLFQDNEIQTTVDLRQKLSCDGFRDELLGLFGVGKKTIDYMACLVGLDSIAVDRHVRAFAVRSGVQVTDYDALKRVFSYAADILNSSRRQFDAWVWKTESEQRMRKAKDDARRDTDTVSNGTRDTPKEATKL